MTARRWVLRGVLLAALAGVLAATSPSGVRLGLAVVGCLLLPGLGWARKMRAGDLGDTVALAVTLSICSTVAVGTAMAVAGTWSLGWGLAVLALVAVTGFVPAGALADRATTRVQARVARFGDDGGAWANWVAQSAEYRRRRAEAAADQASDVWMDWYADAERRALEEQARKTAAAREATDAWTAWYRRTQLPSSRLGTKDDER